MNLTPYPSHDIETGLSNTDYGLENLKKQFLEFKGKTEHEIYKIKEAINPSGIYGFCINICKLGEVAAYIILWLIVFHKI